MAHSTHFSHIHLILDLKLNPWKITKILLEIQIQI